MDPDGRGVGDGAAASRGILRFYVGKADSSLFNESSQLILARDGQRTTISMRND